MKNIVYTSPFIPAEWITAHALRPVKIRPGSDGNRRFAAGLPGTCPYALGFLQDAIDCADTAAVIFTTACDQMRRIVELADKQTDIPTFMMNLPATWQNASAFGLYQSELKRLGRFLSEISGHNPFPSSLADIMYKFDDDRRLLRQAEACLTEYQYSQAIADFYRNGSLPTLAADINIPTGPAIAIFGGSLMQQEKILFDLVEDTGGHIALDATSSGLRAMPRRFNLRQLKLDPFAELADAYFGSLTDAFRRPNSELYKWLKNEIVIRDIKGIIFHRYLWCDLWHAEAKRLKDWADIPVLDLDCNDNDGTNSERIKTRIQAFVEMLL